MLSDQELMLALEAGDVGIWRWDIAADRFRGSANLAPMHGIAAGGFRGKFSDSRDFIHPEDRDEVARVISRTLREGGRYLVQYRLPPRDDVPVRWIESRGTVVMTDGKATELYGICQDITDRKRVEQELQRLAAIVEASGDAIYSWTEDGTIVSWNPEATRLFGYTAEEALGMSFLKLVPPERGPNADEVRKRLWQGETLRQYETTRLHKDGTVLDVALTVSPVRGAQGRPVAMSTIARDIGERRAAEAQRELLVRELDHRVKNMLALVSALVNQTMTTAATKEQAQESLAGRLRALAGAHELLLRGGWESADLEALVRLELSPYVDGGDDGRLVVAGPKVELDGAAAPSVGMALHELTTNAVKYGALSTPDGRLAIRWRLLDGECGPQVELHWRETGGPPPRPPSRRGFGTTLIERVVGSRLGGGAELRFDSEGVICHLRFSQRADAVAVASSSSAAPARSPD